jgi:hypothetical protein
MSHARRLGAQIGFVFKMISERTDLKTSEYAKASFQEFILRLLVAQHREHEEHKRDETHANRAIPYEKVDLDYSVIFNAIMSAFESKKSEPDALANYSLAESTRKIDPAGGASNKELNIDEQLIIDALKAVQLQPDHIE